MDMNWINTKEAMKLLNIKSENTLKGWKKKYNLTTAKIVGKNYWHKEQLINIFPFK